MIPGYPTKAVQSYMRGGAAPAAEEKRQQPLKFQLGRIATPIRVTRCGWPSDAGKKCLGGLAVVHDNASIQTLKELEGQVQAQYPQSQLNSCITTILEDPDTGMPVPIIRLKFSRSPGACSVVEYGRTGDHDPALGPPREMSDLRNGHLVVAMVSPKAWQRDGTCGVALYANKVNCLGHRLGGAGAREETAEVVWE